MNAKTTKSCHVPRCCFSLLAALCLTVIGMPSHADEFTSPDQLIGVTQGFLEFTVEDYLATGQIEGRYQIQVNN
ncbi:MAG: flagellar biosynthesis protein FlgA, partial [Pseudomonadales bacterium]|nr:flagellar biosynthesis protein FlgA [Pseudomonadales bacterium]